MGCFGGARLTESGSDEGEVAGRLIEVDRLADHQDWYGCGRERAGCIQIERGVSAPSDENSRRKVQNVGANSTINKIRGPHVYQTHNHRALGVFVPEQLR